MFEKFSDAAERHRQLKQDNVLRMIQRGKHMIDCTGTAQNHEMRVRQYNQFGQSLPVSMCPHLDFSINLALFPFGITEDETLLMVLNIFPLKGNSLEYGQAVKFYTGLQQLTPPLLEEAQYGESDVPLNMDTPLAVMSVGRNINTDEIIYQVFSHPMLPPHTAVPIMQNELNGFITNNQVGLS